MAPNAHFGFCENILCLSEDMALEDHVVVEVDSGSGGEPQLQLLEMRSGAAESRTFCLGSTEFPHTSPLISMFSRLLTNARNILSRSPSAQDIPSASIYELKDTSSTLTDELDTGMVTTRRGTDTESPAVDDSSTKSALKRGWEEQPSPISSTKRRKYVGKETGADGNTDVDEETGNGLEIHDTVVVKAAVQTQHEDGEGTEEKPTETDPESTTPKKRGKLALRGKSETPQERRNSPKVVITKRPTDQTNSFASDEALTDNQPSMDPESIYATPVAERATSIYITPTTEKKKAESSPLQLEPSLSAEIEAEGAPASSAEKKNRKEQKKASKETMDTDAPSQPTPTASAKPTHIRFNSEDPPPPVDPTTSTAPAPEPRYHFVRPGHIVDTSSDDDEAPETVTRASALESTKAAHAEATKAAKR